jgi:hypothetical protein
MVYLNGRRIVKPMADGEPDAAQAFAALMNDAATEAAPPPGDEAPYGYTTDPLTGERRPKKAAGRPRKSPSLEELRAAREAEPAGDAAQEPAADRAPGTSPKTRARRGKNEPKPVPPFREGQIARGVNKLYRRAGRIVRAWDPVVGEALIEITRKEDDADTTVGEAWENIARHNVRVRRVLLALIRGGDWGALVWAHSPVIMAILMKDSVQKHLPLHKIVAAFFSSDEDEGPPPPAGAVPGEVIPPDMPGSPGNGAGPLPGGLTKEDLMQLSEVADRLMSNGPRRSAGMPRARPSAARAAGESPPGG